MLAIINKLDSGTIRGLIAATLPLLGLIATLFGVDKAVFDTVADKWVQILLALLTAGGVAWAAWSRLFNPTPPLTETAAQKTVDKINAGTLETTTPTDLRSHPLVGVLLLLTTILMLTGCPATLAVKEAQTMEQRAGALIGDFTIFQRAALEIGNDTSVPTDVRQKVVAAPIALRPAVDHGIDLLRSYRLVSEQLARGVTGEDRVRIAAANLTAWIVDLTPKIAALRQTIEESRK